MKSEVEAGTLLKGSVDMVATKEYGQSAIFNRIHTRWAGSCVKFYDTTDSTNLQAKQEAEAGAAHGTLIVADMQTAGKGRRGRSWDSPAGSNIYFTLLLKPLFSPEKASMVTLVMATAIARAIGLETGLKTGIKWPNDIVLDGKKMCGILTEMSVQSGAIDYVIIGAGINVGEQEFAPELAEKAAYLNAFSENRIDRSSLVARIMECFEEDYAKFEDRGDLSGLLEEYHGLLVNKDTQVCVLDPKGDYCGIARGITPEGELLVELPDGEVRCVYAGEVSVRGIYGYV